MFEYQLRLLLDYFRDVYACEYTNERYVHIHIAIEQIHIQAFLLVQFSRPGIFNWTQQFGPAHKTDGRTMVQK